MKYSYCTLLYKNQLLFDTNFNFKDMQHILPAPVDVIVVSILFFLHKTLFYLFIYFLLQMKTMEMVFHYLKGQHFLDMQK